MSNASDYVVPGGGSVTTYTYRTKTRTTKKWRYQFRVYIEPGNPDAGKKLVGKSGYSTKKEAQAALREAIKRAEQNRPLVSSSLTLGQYAQDWLDSRRLAASTRASYKKIIRNHIEPNLGNKKLVSITPTMLNSLYIKLQENGRKDGKHAGEPLSLNSINKVHTLISQILESAYGDKHISENVAKNPTVEPPRARDIAAEKPEIKVWTPQELKAFLQWNRDEYEDDLYTLWLVYARTGIRRSEGLALKWSDFNPAQQTLAVRRTVDPARPGQIKPPKSGKARVIDLPGDVVDALKRWKSIRAQMSFDFGQGESYIFGNNTGGLRSPNEIGRRWTYRVKLAQESIKGLPRITVHGLRHTHATHLLTANVHPKIVQERLGHSTISITLDTYSHLMPSTQRASVQQLEALYA